MRVVQAVNPVVCQRALERARAEGRRETSRWGWLRTLLGYSHGTSEQAEYTPPSPWA
jgi:hypothetical protein